MDIRIAELEDLDGVVALMERVYAAFGEPQPTGDALREFVGSVLAERHRLVFVVAEEMGELVGMLSLAFCPTTLHLATFAYLDDFHVRHESRGRGIGRALLRFACEYAQRAGAVEIKLTAKTANPRITRLYRDLGFAPSSLPLYVQGLDGPPGGSAA